MSTGTAVRLHALDGLRGLAALLVLVQHLGAPALGDALRARGFPQLGFFVTTLGASGVELFYVLSAVVLARPYLRGSRELALGTYARRRVERLFPPYLVAWLLAGAVAYATTLWPSPFSATAALPVFDPVAWLKQAGMLYFAVHYNPAWWSLTVECLFYLLMPGLIPVLRRVPATGASAALLLALTSALSFATTEPENAMASVQGYLRLLAIYAPCFAAGLILSRQELGRRLTLALLVCGGAVLWLASMHGAVHRQVGYGLVYTALVARALDPYSRLARLLGRWRLVWLGERSYSLFLTHCTVIVLVMHVLSVFVPMHGAAWLLWSRGLSLPFVLLATVALFSGVERRFARNLVTGASLWPRRAVAQPPAPAALGEEREHVARA